MKQTIIWIILGTVIALVFVITQFWILPALVVLAMLALAPAD